MSRGLGVRQRAVLDALRALDAREPGRWWTPAEVLVALGVSAPRVATLAPAPMPVDPIEDAQLARCRDMVRMGYREFAAGVLLIEARRAERAEAWKARQRAAARTKAPRYPNQRRPVPRGGEAGNPSRVFALLARRGLVERAASRGPGSAVRVAGEFLQPLKAADPGISRPVRAHARGGGR